MAAPQGDKCADARAALTSGDWTASLLEHALDCDVCSELCLLELLARVADTPAYQLTIPDSNVVWWRAQLVAGQRRACAARRPHLVAQIFAATGLFLSFLVLANDIPLRLEFMPGGADSLRTLTAVVVVLVAMSGWVLSQWIGRASRHWA